MGEQQTSRDVAFVAGATGYTGQAVVNELLARGVRVLAHVRPDSSRLEHWRAAFPRLGATIDETPWDEAALRATFAARRPTIVFALLGTTKKRIRAHADVGGAAAEVDYLAVDYGLTAMLARAAADLDPKPRFVYLSAVGVTPTARSPYYQARYRAESELRAGGLDVVIARPSFITGADRDERRPTERVAAGALDGALALAGLVGLKAFRDRYQSLTGPELASALVNLALDPAAGGQVYETDALRRFIR